MIKLKQISHFVTTYSTRIWCRNISLTNVSRLDRDWRAERGLSENPNAHGPLTNLPDFTYMDGRPTPMGSNQKKRLMKQKEIASKMVTMCKELEFAKERHNRITAEKETAKRDIIDNKLKPKGHLLLHKD